MYPSTYMVPGRSYMLHPSFSRSNLSTQVTSTRPLFPSFPRYTYPIVSLPPSLPLSLPTPSLLAFPAICDREAIPAFDSVKAITPSCIIPTIPHLDHVGDPGTYPYLYIHTRPALFVLDSLINATQHRVCQTPILHDIQFLLVD